ncbi:MAG: protoporphyrinogen oxidase [Polyangiaceae bacterium]
MNARRVLVAGGGISGLAAAYRLLETARKESRALEVTVLEERTRFGGVIHTERHGDFVLDAGPDSFLTTKPQARALCQELGLGAELIETRSENRRVLVRHQEGLHELPEGLMLAIPTRIVPLVRSRLFTWSGKLRMGLDLLIPPRRDEADESMAGFLRRRLGAEALLRLGEPLMAGIYAGDAAELSIRSTFPQLVELERRHGSLIRGALAQRRAARGKPAPAAFNALRGGMGELPAALVRAIEQLRGRMLRGRRLVALTRSGDGGAGGRFSAQVSGEAGDELFAADDVLLALPAFASADVLQHLDAELAAELRGIPYLSSATAVLAYPRSAVRHPLDALGLIVPRDQATRALAATFISSKWEARAPADAVLLRLFFGGSRDPDVLHHGDDVLLERARRELRALLGIDAEPLFARVFRYERASAQPLVGHAARLGRVRAAAARTPGLHLAAGGLDGIGIPDCIRQADAAARAILALQPPTSDAALLS